MNHLAVMMFLLPFLFFAPAAYGLLLGSCDTSDVWNKSCSPNWCVFDTNVGCLFPPPTWTYAADLASLTCKQCTQSTAPTCTAASLKAKLKVCAHVTLRAACMEGRSAWRQTEPTACDMRDLCLAPPDDAQSPDGQIKAAYCNDQFLVIHSNGQPNHLTYLDNIPTPPGAGGEGLNTVSPYTQCHTRGKVDQWQSFKVSSQRQYFCTGTGT